MVSGTYYRVSVALDSTKIAVFRDSVQRVSWTGATRASGKLGFRHSYRSGLTSYWDNVTVTTSGPGKVVASDDYYPFGMQMEQRSTNSGSGDARYKYTSKERDAETNYEYFGARYY